jgi:predicted small secreted protein
MAGNPAEDGIMHRTAILTAFAFFACAGCNTISGLGKDVQAVGKVMSKTADNAGRAKASAAACVSDSRVPPRTCPPASKTQLAASKSKARPVTVRASAPAKTPPATPAPTPVKAKAG